MDDARRRDAFIIVFQRFAHVLRDALYLLKLDKPTVDAELESIKQFREHLSMVRYSCRATARVGIYEADPTQVVVRIVKPTFDPIPRACSRCSRWIVKRGGRFVTPRRDRAS